MNPPEGTPPPRRRLPRARHVSLGAVVLFVSLIAGGVAFLLSEAGLPFVIARVIGESGGRLTVEGASGSLASTMRFARLAWNGPEATIAADDVVVEWSALALFSRRLALRGLGADHIALAVKPSTGATAPPANLALPLAVDIDHVTVTQLDWQAGPRSGKITGLEFGYDGDAQIHRIRGLRLFSDVGALTGEASLRATAPFPVDGTIAIVGDGPLDGAKLDAALSGTLPALVVDAKGTMHDASMVAHVALTPFAGGAFESANVALERVDLAAFHDGLPQTQLALALDARPRDGSVAGGFRATNALPGSLDLHRLPLTAAAGNYAYASDALSLTVLDIELEGGGRARGDGQVNLGARDAPSSWRLTVRDLDLARLHPALVRTRLTGSLAADVDGARQTIDGNLAEPSLAVAFAVTHAEGRLDVTRFRAEAPGGSLTGSGKIALDAPRAFDVTLAARRFDPARFVALPAGSLDGTIKATGVLLPEGKPEAEIARAPGSRVAGVALAGTVRGTATRRTLRAAAIDITAAGTRLTAHGDAGVAGDRLAFAFDAPRLADLAPLAPASLPHPLAGSIRATGTLALEPGGAGGDVDLKGDGVRIGAEFAAQTIALQASFAPGGSANAATPRNARPLTLSAAATRIVVRQISLASARADIRGTLASHKATLAARGDAIDAAAELAGGFDDLQSAAQWRGQLLALTNRGDVPLTLTSPAALELGPAHARLANAHIVTADGRADVGDLQWNNGRVTTRGTFEGVPLASLATIAGRPLPMASTLKLSGDWSIAAAPRLTGAFAIRRQSGDLFGATPIRQPASMSRSASTRSRCRARCTMTHSTPNSHFARRVAAMRRARCRSAPSRARHPDGSRPMRRSPLRSTPSWRRSRRCSRGSGPRRSSTAAHGSRSPATARSPRPCSQGQSRETRFASTPRNTVFICATDASARISPTAALQSTRSRSPAAPVDSPRRERSPRAMATRARGGPKSHGMPKISASPIDPTCGSSSPAPGRSPCRSGGSRSPVT
jgi:translocation and assembly module TamB